MMGVIFIYLSSIRRWIYLRSGCEGGEQLDKVCSFKGSRAKNNFQKRQAPFFADRSGDAGLDAHCCVRVNTMRKLTVGIRIPHKWTLVDHDGNIRTVQMPITLDLNFCLGLDLSCLFTYPHLLFRCLFAWTAKKTAFGCLTWARCCPSYTMHS